MKIALFCHLLFLSCLVQAVEQEAGQHVPARKTYNEIQTMLAQKYLQREPFETLEAMSGTIGMKSILYTNGDREFFVHCPEKRCCKVSTFKRSTNTTTEEFHAYDGTLIKKVEPFIFFTCMCKNQQKFF